MVLCYGVLDSRTLVAGGRTVRTVLRISRNDIGAASEARTIEWEVVSGPPEGRTDQRLARRRLDVEPGGPIVDAVDVAVPTRIRQARLGAVVRILGRGHQPTLAHVLSNSTLEVTELP